MLSSALLGTLAKRPLPSHLHGQLFCHLPERVSQWERWKEWGKAEGGGKGELGVERGA